MKNVKISSVSNFEKENAGVATRAAATMHCKAQSPAKPRYVRVHQLSTDSLATLPLCVSPLPCACIRQRAMRQVAPRLKARCGMARLPESKSASVLLVKLAAVWHCTARFVGPHVPHRSTHHGARIACEPSSHRPRQCFTFTTRCRRILQARGFSPRGVTGGPGVGGPRATRPGPAQTPKQK